MVMTGSTAAIAEVERLREENARLTRELLEAHGRLAAAMKSAERSTALRSKAERERDEARAEVVRMAAQRDIALVHGPEDLIRALEELTRERDDLQEHERQTHERLGAILGTDDSLEECAKRLRQRVEELEREAGILTQGITDQHDRVQRAEAEVARLREALEPISTLPCPVQGALGRPCGLCSGCLARAALAAAKGE